MIFKSLTKKKLLFILGLWCKTKDDEPRTKDNERRTMHTAIGGGNDECLMDCQYKYVFAGDTDHHGFVSHHSGEWADPVVKKGIGH